MVRIGKGELVIVSISILLLALMFTYPLLRGGILILALLLLGSISVILKSPSIRIISLGAMIILAIINILLLGGPNNLHYGIDFSGGVRIPIVLDKSVNPTTMQQIVEILKKRISLLGLTQPKVMAVGDSLVYVEIPGGSEEQINYVKDVLSHQGVYLSVIDGKVAVKGEDILPASVQRTSYRQLQEMGVDWGVSFTITAKANERFKKVAQGKGGKPIYMFIDRPANALVAVSKQMLTNNTEYEVKEVIKALNDASRLENAPIEIYVFDASEINYTMLIDDIVIKANASNLSTVILPESIGDISTNLSSLNYSVKEMPDEYFTPHLYTTSTGDLIANEWQCIGLLSAPILSDSIASGKTIGQTYVITGSVPSQDSAEKFKLARKEENKVKSILKGGALPVGISIGSATNIPPSLGKQFKELSILGIIIAIVVIALFVSIRYMHLKATLVIIAISISELIILISILGSFTIDLAAMAGIIAAIGVGVDSQIIITDEILKKEERDVESKIESAFEIIKVNITIAIITMLPLLLSQLVEIINFAITTILGALLGYLLSRPAYAVLAEKILK